MPPVLLCSHCGKLQKGTPVSFLMKQEGAHRHYHRLCEKCSTAEPRKKLEAEGWVEYLHTATH